MREEVCRELHMICRRNVPAFFGHAAAVGLIASPALLITAKAEAQTSTTAATPPPEPPKCGTVRRQERRTGCTERRKERRMGRTERREERRTGRDERRDVRDGAADQKK